MTLYYRNSITCLLWDNNICWGLLLKIIIIKKKQSCIVKKQICIIIYSKKWPFSHGEKHNCCQSMIPVCPSPSMKASTAASGVPWSRVKAGPTYRWTQRSNHSLPSHVLLFFLCFPFKFKNFIIYIISSLHITFSVQSFS